MTDLSPRLNLDPNDPETIAYDLQGLADEYAPGDYQHGARIILHHIQEGVEVLGRLAIGNVTKMEVKS